MHSHRCPSWWRVSCTDAGQDVDSEGRDGPRQRPMAECHGGLHRLLWVELADVSASFRDPDAHRTPIRPGGYHGHPRGKPNIDQK